MTFHYFISNLLEPISYGLCGVFILFFLRRNNKMKWRVLMVYYFIAVALLVKAAHVETNIEIYSFLSLLTFICLGTYFYYTLLSLWKKRVVLLGCFIQAGYYIMESMLFPDAKVFDSTGYVILSIGVVLMSFMYIHQLLTNVTEEPLSLNFDFWFVSSQLFYHLGSFFIFLTYGYLTQKILLTDLYSYENRIYLSQLWRVHNGLLFLNALIIAVGSLWISFRRKSPSL
jgi:hypothetical protein